MTRRNLNVMGNVFANNTFKFAANVMMAMLFITLISACSGETDYYHPAQASNLMGTMNEANGLGWATIDVTASAKDINGDPISAAADVRYECKKEVPVENEEELGLPVVLSLAGDNLIATGDGNVITRTENHSASKGVTLNVAGPDLSKGGTLGELTSNGDTLRREVFAYPGDAAFATADLPEGKDKEWRDSKTSTLRYYRVFVKKAAPVEPEYKRYLELDFEPGSVGADMASEKWLGDKLVERATCYGEIASWGQYDPQVTSITVTGTNFVNKDELGVNKRDEATDKDLPGLGDGGKYTRKCIRHTSETFSDEFPSEGGMKPIRGQLDVWVYSFECELSDGHKETFSIEFEIVSVKNAVDPNTNTYERIIEVKVNGKTVDTMNGKVRLELK